jgi:hypothetical protein
MFLRLKYAKERPDLEGKPYMLEREGWGESTTGRSEYASALPRPGTGGSSVCLFLSVILHPLSTCAVFREVA